MPVFVIGHRNPDTDAICSAIAYAWFLRETSMPDAEPACCGEINARAQFVLTRAGVEPPRLIMDVRPTVGQICQREVMSARTDEAVIEVYQRMRTMNYQTAVVRDGEGALVGLIPMRRLMELLLPEGQAVEDMRRVQSSLARVARVVRASFHHVIDEHREEVLTVMVGAMSAESFTRHMREFPAEHLLVVAGNRPTVQRPAIEYGVRALVVTGGFPLDPDLLTAARKRGVSVLASSLDTASTTLLIRGAKVISPAVETTFLQFRDKQLVGDVIRATRDTLQNLFPVFDEGNRQVGLFTKADLLNAKPARLILVDHNELAQAVSGVESADILEVIDHHRLGGGLNSREPIRFVNEPVGSTCTIVTKFLHHRDMVPPKPMAICLMGGIVSDTLNLTSPTTTATDREMLAWLSTACGLDVKSFAEELFAAGSALQSHPPAEALRMDCKEYEENEWRFAVAQIEENGLERFWNNKDALTRALDGLVKESRLDFACLLITDITQNSSFLLTAGSERVDDAIDYPKADPRLFELEGVVSRKKQLLPHLIRILSKLAR